MTGIFPDADARIDESVRALEAALVIEPALLIEAVGSDRQFYPFLEESQNSTETVRYIRIRGASGLSEISVYGARESSNEI